MTGSTFTSLEQLGAWELAAKGRALHVTAQIADGADGRPALRECRTAAMGWVGHRLGGELPRRAARHRSFQYDDGESRCRGVRERSGRGDFWAARVELGAGTDRASVTELVVAAPGDGAEPTVGARVPDWPASSGQAPETLPPDVLRHIAGAAPLVLGGEALVLDAAAVWTPQAMQEFIAALVDPARPLPVVVITEPTYGGDAHALLERSARVARALTGLATVTVLPQRFTYTLSDTVTKTLSVYDGAWRVYLPGFSRTARRFDHPVYLRERVETDAGLERTTQEILRIAGDHHVRTAAAEGIRFDTVLPPEARLAEAALRLARPWRRLPATVSAGAARLAGPPRRWIGRRRSYGPATTRAPGSGAGMSSAGTGPEVRAPAETETAKTEGAALRDELSGLRRDLKAARKRGETLARERDRAREMEATARVERESAEREARRLEGLVRLAGGNPKAPFPVGWDDVVTWCASALEGRVVLADAVRRSLNRALFEDVGLAAVCLHWLGNEYREARLGGGEGHLYGMIPGLADGIRNQRCGGDSFDFDWRGERHRVDWHLKNGGNTRDPRRCLRIYYFWDAARREVVVASMPQHRRSAMT